MTDADWHSWRAVLPKDFDVADQVGRVAAVITGCPSVLELALQRRFYCA